MDDVVLNKAGTIERCLARVREVYAGDPLNLRDDLTRQDSIILNIQRACEAAIDLAMHLVRVKKLGLPQESRHAFELLSQAGEIGGDLATALMRMVGFRNIAIHEYQSLDLDIVESIIARELDDLARFAEQSVRRYG